MLRAQRVLLSLGLLAVAALVHGHYVTYGAAATGHLFRLAPATEQAALAARERMKREYRPVDAPLTGQELEDAAADAAESAADALAQGSPGVATRPKRSKGGLAPGFNINDPNSYTPDWVTEEFKQEMDSEKAQRAVRASERKRKAETLRATALAETDRKGIYFGAFASESAGQSPYERQHNAFWYGLLVPALLSLGACMLSFRSLGDVVVGSPSRRDNVDHEIGQKVNAPDVQGPRFRRMGKVDYGLGMLVSCAPIAYLAAGIVGGFEEWPASGREVVFLWAEWFGVALIALVVSILTLKFGSIRTALSVFLVLVASSGWLIGLGRSPKTQDAETLTGKPSVIESQAEPGDVLVNEVVEIIPSGMILEPVDDTVIAMMEGVLVSDAKKKLKIRLSAAPDRMKSVQVSANTMRSNRDGHVVYVTDVIVTENGKPVEQAEIKVIWNIEGGKLKRVFCWFPDKGYAWGRGKCGKQVAESFNWKGWSTR